MQPQCSSLSVKTLEAVCSMDDMLAAKLHLLLCGTGSLSNAQYRMCEYV